MARPAKNVNVQSAAMTKEQRESRQKAEQKLKSAGLPEPPAFLTDKQKDIFVGIVIGLQEADILGKLDEPILAQAAISIDRLQTIEDKINKAPQALFDKDVMSARDKYSKDFFRCCNELSLSPQSRAKMALTAYKNKQETEDPLIGTIKKRLEND